MTENASELMAAATQVMKALEPLAPEDRERVLRSAAELYAIHVPGTPHGKGASSNKVGVKEDPNAQIHDGGKQLSLVEFLESKQPATNRQRIASFAYYREHIEGQGTQFSKVDLVGYFATAKLAKPGNYDRDWNDTVRDGWIHDDGAASYLTKTGEDAVKAGFGGKGKRRGSSVSKKSKKSSGQQ